MSESPDPNSRRWEALQAAVVHASAVAGDLRYTKPIEDWGKFDRDLEEGLCALPPAFKQAAAAASVIAFLLARGRKYGSTDQAAVVLNTAFERLDGPDWQALRAVIGTELGLLDKYRALLQSLWLVTENWGD